MTAGGRLTIFKLTPVFMIPSFNAWAYCMTRMTPCESWPARLLSTRLRATTAASSAGTPRPTKRSWANVVSAAGGKVGTAVFFLQEVVGQAFQPDSFVVAHPMLSDMTSPWAGVGHARPHPEDRR